MVSGQDSAPEEHPETGPRLRLYSLGVFEVYQGDEHLDRRGWKSQKTRYLLAFLAAQGGKPVGEEAVMESFWPGRAKTNLYAACSHLRSHLRPSASQDYNYIVRQSGTLRLDTELPVWHDLDELESLFSQATRVGRDTPEGLELLGKAAGLYRGPYLEGCTMEWADPIRTRMDRLVTDALTRLSENALATNRFERALETSYRVLDIDHCNQDAHLTLIRALAALDRPEQAVRQYELYEATLLRELDLEPAPVVTAAYEEVLRQRRN